MIYQQGDRIEMVEMLNDPRPILPGERGTVKGSCPTPVRGEIQLWVDWDNGRTLSVLLPTDKIKKVPHES